MKTTSLELSKYLYEHGVVLETEKWWVPDILNNELHWRIDKFNSGYTCLWKDTKLEKIPAFSCEELLEMLPETIEVGKDYHLEILKVDNQFIIGYRNFYINTAADAPCIITTFNKSLPEALGLMCEWLLDNGYKLKNGGLG